MISLRKVLFAVALAFSLSGAIRVYAQDPGVVDTVRTGNVAGDVHAILSVPVTLYNDETLVSIVIPILIDGKSGYMTFDSASFGGSRLENMSLLPEREIYVYATDTISYEALVLRFGVSSGDPLPPGDGLLCDLWFSPKFGGEVILDTMIVSPYGNLKLTDESMTDFLPKFRSGSAEIACDYVAGDMNEDWAVNFGDFLSLYKGYFGCNYIFGLIPHRDDMNGDRRVDARDGLFLINYIFFGGPVPGCGVYHTADYSDPGARDTLYIEDAILHEGVPSYITINYTNDQAIQYFALAFKWDGNVDFYFFWGDDENVPGKRWPDPSILTKYSCPSTIEGTTGEFLFFPRMVMKDTFGEELPPGSGPIFNAPFTPRSVGTSTIRLADFYSGSESMFVTAYEEAVVPVVVGGNITVFPRFCGDANGDDQVDIGDAVYIINYVFKGGQPPTPECSGDANLDSSCNIGDAVYMINYAFKGGSAPVENCCP